jgi:hypothetical protein
MDAGQQLLPSFGTIRGPPVRAVDIQDMRPDSQILVHDINDVPSAT